MDGGRGTKKLCFFSSPKQQEDNPTKRMKQRGINRHRSRRGWRRVGISKPTVKPFLDYFPPVFSSNESKKTEGGGRSDTPQLLETQVSGLVVDSGTHASPTGRWGRQTLIQQGPHKARTPKSTSKKIDVLEKAKEVGDHKPFGMRQRKRRKERGEGTFIKNGQLHDERYPRDSETLLSERHRPKD